MLKSDSIQNLAAALAKAQSRLQNAKNTVDNPFYKSKYAPLGDILDLVRPALAENNLSIVQYPSSEDGKTIAIHTMLAHASGEYIDFDPLTLTADKITPQGAGAAITYGRRYSISGIFNIASEDDDDGNAFEKVKPVETTKHEQKQQQEIENTKPDEVGNIKITFGKHKGQTLADIAKQDISYVEWIAEKGRDESIRKAAGLLLNGTPEPRKDVRVTPKDSTPQAPPPPTEPPAQEIRLPWDEGGKANGK